MKLKTRTNQPVYYKLPVSSNMEQLSDGLLNSLKVGDVVQKKTGNQKHCYVVTYKEEKHGICLTYVDCGYMETISYDYTNGHWVYNSKDVCEVASKGDVKLENIKDRYGHNRFVEDDITLTELPTGIEVPYAKWSLSGTHLMIVVCLNIASGTTTQIVNRPIYLPQWILDKITPVFGTYVENKGNQPIYGSNANQVGTILNNISKPTSHNYLNIAFYIGSATTEDGSVRIEYDLLIDNASEE